MEHRPFYAVRPLLPVYPEPEDPSPARKRWILVQGSSVLFLKDPAYGTVLMPDPLLADLVCGAPVYLGTRDDLFFYAAEVPAGVTLPGGWGPSPVRELSGKVPDSDMAVAAYAVRILDFDRSTAFCGRCGAQTRQLTTERARICTACSRIVYPRISPAIIVLVKTGEEVLLARSPRSHRGSSRSSPASMNPARTSSRPSAAKSARKSALRCETSGTSGASPGRFPIRS